MTVASILTGALWGVAGLIIAGGVNHTGSVGSAGGRGFTAIMVTWLAKFNPIYMVLTSFLLVLVISSVRKKRENQPPAFLGLSYFREER